ncbi:MAG: FliO/MopB family protein [Magnetococcales bacterium]|nr:FliO/MopB family protein [Magnetococcales bacterium]
MIRFGVVGRLLFSFSLLIVVAVLVEGVLGVRLLPVAVAAGKTTAPPEEKVMPPDGKVAVSDVKSPAEGKLAAAEGAAQTSMGLPATLFGEASLKMAGYLLILVVLAVFVVHLGKRFRTQLGGGGPIFVEDGRNLAPGVGVRLIRVGARYWLIGVTKEQVTLLGELTEEDVLGEYVAEDGVELEPEPVLSKARHPRDLRDAEPSLVDRGLRR